MIGIQWLNEIAFRLARIRNQRLMDSTTETNADKPSIVTITSKAANAYLHSTQACKTKMDTFKVHNKYISIRNCCNNSVLFYYLYSVDFICE